MKKIELKLLKGLLFFATGIFLMYDRITVYNSQGKIIYIYGNH